MIYILMTTHNRKEKTLNCVMSLKRALERQIAKGNRIVLLDADAASSDGTPEMLEGLKDRVFDVKVMGIPSESYWNTGMRIAMKRAARMAADDDLIMLINDDVIFYDGAADKMIKLLKEKSADAVVGAFCDSLGSMSYGGVKQKSRHFARFELIKPGKDKLCDTFNCNCLIMKKSVMMQTGNLDKKYTHSMGDYDYGLKMKRKGLKVISSEEYAGCCDDNDRKGSWMDRDLPISERIRLKESPKGLPYRDWYHFIRKNYGLLPALYHSATPYIRIFTKH